MAFALLMLLFCGCSSGRYTTMYLNQLVHERAEQEVKIETMSLDLEAAQNTIMTLESENQKLREQAGLDTEIRPLRNRQVRQAPESRPAIDDAQKKKTRPSDDQSGVPDLEITPLEEDASPPALDAKNAPAKRGDEVESPPDETSVESFLPNKAARANDPPSEDASPEELPNPRTDTAENAAEDSLSQAISLTIDRSLTRGEDLDGQPGDEGVLIVLQPRDAAGKYLPQTGSVVIEVVDSPTATKEDSAAQVAEWKFSQDEVRRATRNSSLGRGAYLSVDWDEHLPTHEKLLLIAKWKSPSGEVLTAEHVVRVNLQKGSTAWDSRLQQAEGLDQPSESVATRPSGPGATKSWAPARR